jgi:hypothetical protein
MKAALRLPEFLALSLQRDSVESDLTRATAEIEITRTGLLYIEGLNKDSSFCRFEALSKLGRDLKNLYIILLYSDGIPTEQSQSIIFETEQLFAKKCVNFELILSANDAMTYSHKPNMAILSLCMDNSFLE